MAAVVAVVDERNKKREEGRKRGKGQSGGVETGARSTHMFITEKLRRSPLAAPQNQGVVGRPKPVFFLIYM